MGFLINKAKKKKKKERESARWESLTLSKHCPPAVPAPRVATALDTGCRTAKGRAPPCQGFTPVAARSGATGSSVRPRVT